MKHYLVVFIFFMMVGCLGGQSFNSHTYDESLAQPGGCADPTDLEFCAVMEIIVVQCVDCHDNAHNEWATYDTSEKWIAQEKIIAGDPDGSPLINRLVNAGSDMPRDKPALSDEDYQILRTWILNL